MRAKIALRSRIEKSVVIRSTRSRIKVQSALACNGRYKLRLALLTRSFRQLLQRGPQQLLYGQFSSFPGGVLQRFFSCISLIAKVCERREGVIEYVVGSFDRPAAPAGG